MFFKIYIKEFNGTKIVTVQVFEHKMSWKPSDVKEILIINFSNY